MTPQGDERRQQRLGLALSGGGFRAAFFHIGVLARMAELDRNERYRWTRYSRLQPDQANFELAYAVAASACVPTLFHPLPVTRLLQDPKRNPITVQLVDGGVHDNQGIDGLIEYDCNPIVVSDASGYLPDHRDPTTRIPAVGAQARGIYGDRVRGEQLMNARVGRDETAFGLMHLRKGVIGHAFSPIGAGGEPILPPRPEPPGDFRGERFQVDGEVQKCLSRVRTDLDAFSEVEVHSLMLDGYRMTAPNLVRLDMEGRGPPLEPRKWAFNDVATAAETNGPELYRRHLTRASSRFGKAIFLSVLGAFVVLAFSRAFVAAASSGFCEASPAGNGPQREQTFTFGSLPARKAALRWIAC